MGNVKEFIHDLETLKNDVLEMLPSYYKDVDTREGSVFDDIFKATVYVLQRKQEHQR